MLNLAHNDRATSLDKLPVRWHPALLSIPISVRSYLVCLVRRGIGLKLVKLRRETEGRNLGAPVGVKERDLLWLHSSGLKVAATDSDKVRLNCPLASLQAHVFILRGGLIDSPVDLELGHPVATKRAPAVPPA
jgi:hypothetical protein